MEMNVKTSSRKVNGLIQQVKTSANRYNGLVQAAIVAIIVHAKDYGDCTGAARLLEAMPRSNRRSLAIAHFTQFSPIAVQKGKDKKFSAHFRKPEAKDYNAFNIDGVRANNWWERPESEKLEDVVTFESSREALNKFLGSLETKADKASNEDKANIIAFVRAIRSAASRIVTGEEAKTGAANTDKAAPSTKVA